VIGPIVRHLGCDLADALTNRALCDRRHTTKTRADLVFQQWTRRYRPADQSECEHRVMSNARTYRQRAADCLKFATEAEEFYVRIALLELAEDFNSTAAELERDERRLSTHPRPRRSRGSVALEVL
jgi:hypothetical protein